MTQLPKYLEVVLDVLAHCTEPDKDPELRFDMLVLLEFVLDTQKIEAAVRANSSEIVKKVLVQSLLWRSGKPSIKIRKAAVLIFSKLLAKSLIEAAALHKQYPEVIASLKNNLEDDWAADLRLASTQFLKQLVLVLQAALDQFELSSLYPLLLARMDDAQDPIRVQTCDAIKAFFACPNVPLAHAAAHVRQHLRVRLPNALHPPRRQKRRRPSRGLQDPRVRRVDPPQDRLPGGTPRSHRPARASPSRSSPDSAKS